MSEFSEGRRSISGVGIGLRTPHINQILTERPDIPWLELLADNHLADGGLELAQLEAIADQYHGETVLYKFVL